MASLDYFLAKFLNCDISEIQEKVQDSITRADVTNYLNGRRVVTTYKNKAGFFKEFIVGDITITSASETFAYNGFMKTTVEQHFYTRHSIKIHRPYNPCAVEICGKLKQHRNYYPLETLRVLPLGRQLYHEKRLYIHSTPYSHRRNDSPWPSRRSFSSKRRPFNPNSSKYFNTKKRHEEEKMAVVDTIDYDNDDLAWLDEKEDNERMEE
jgi:hypothetical protein